MSPISSFVMKKQTSLILRSKAYWTFVLLLHGPGSVNLKLVTFVPNGVSGNPKILWLWCDLLSVTSAVYIGNPLETCAAPDKMNFSLNIILFFLVTKLVLNNILSLQPIQGFSYNHK